MHIKHRSTAEAVAALSQQGGPACSWVASPVESPYLIISERSSKARAPVALAPLEPSVAERTTTGLTYRSENKHAGRRTHPIIVSFVPFFLAYFILKAGSAKRAFHHIHVCARKYCTWRTRGAWLARLAERRLVLLASCMVPLCALKRKIH